MSSDFKDQGFIETHVVELYKSDTKDFEDELVTVLAK